MKLSLLAILCGTALQTSSSTEIVIQNNEQTKRHLKRGDGVDPCSRRNPPTGEAGDLGVLYVVSGSPDYAKEAFLPVVEYLRFKLGIDDAAARGPNEPKWALATEPHLCRGILKDALPFFDVIMTDFDLPIENPGYEEEHRGVRRLDESLPGNRRLGSERFGAWRQGYHDYSQLQKHFVKALKVTAMGQAPFKHTIYLDADSIPCDRNFQQKLVEELGPADIALSPVYEHGFTIPVEKQEHWKTSPGGPNQHNSGCVVLNMSSVRTHELLKLWKYSFFNKEDGKLETRDQTALGKAMLFMYFEKGLQHVDLGPHMFSQHQNMMGLGLGRAECDGSGQWLVIHKTGLIKKEDFLNRN